MKTPFFVTLLLCCALCSVSSHAQRLGWQWALDSKCDGVNYNDEWGFTVDNKGNSFVATVAFYGIYSVFGRDTIYNSGVSNETIVSKIDSNGHYVWSKGFYNSNSLPVDMTTDTAGNLYILGQYEPGTCNIGGFTLTNTVGYDMYFFAKFDPNGNAILAQNIARGGTTLDNPGGINVDNAGNIYVTGSFDTTTNIGSTTLTCAGGLDIFVAKYSASGTPVWAERFGGTGDELTCKLRLTPNGNMYLQANTFSPTITFGVYSFTFARGNSGAFLVKLNNSGAPIWAKELAISTNLVYMTGCATDSLEQVYLTGGFADNLLHLGPFSLYNYASSSNHSTYVAKCDSSGNVLWAIADGSLNHDKIGWSIDIDQCGEIWVCGGDNSNFSSPSEAMFINEYDQSGTPLNNITLSSGGDDQSGIALDKKGNLYVGADYEYSPFNVGTSTFSLTGFENTFVAKYRYFKSGDTILNGTIMISCAPGPVMITAPPGYDYYHWSNGTTGVYDTVYADGTYIVTGIKSCAGTMTIIDTFHVKYVLPTDTVHVNHDTAICAGDVIYLQLPAGWTNYYWYDSTSNITRAHLIDTAGTYWGISINPCTTTTYRVDTFHVSYLQIPFDTLNNNMDTILCSNNNISLDAPQGFTKYYWSDGTAGSIHLNTPPGTWWVYCTPSCPDSIVSLDTFLVRTLPTNLPFSLGADTFVCTAIQLRVPGNGPSYIWQDGSSATNYIVDRSGIFYCTGYEQGCSFADTISVTLPDLTQHLRDTLICVETFKEISVRANVPAGAKNAWNTGSTDPELSITAPGVYWVTVTDRTCTSSDTMTVKTNICSIIIHDVITPNGDGINDKWEIEGLSDYPNNTVQIFDKWGDLVYEKSNYSNDWNGRGKNGVLPDGTYYYIVKLNVPDIKYTANTYTGSLMIKR